MGGRRRFPTVPTGREHEVEQTAPERCPNGHQLTGGSRTDVRCQVSTFPCPAGACGNDNDNGYHVRWTCVRCGAEITDPPHLIPMSETFPPR